MIEAATILLVLMSDDHVEAVAEPRSLQESMCLLSVSGFQQFPIEHAAVDADPFAQNAAALSLVREEGMPSPSAVRVGITDVLDRDAKFRHPLRNEVIHRLGVTFGEMAGVQHRVG